MRRLSDTAANRPCAEADDGLGRTRIARWLALAALCHARIDQSIGVRIFSDKMTAAKLADMTAGQL